MRMFVSDISQNKDSTLSFCLLTDWKTGVMMMQMTSIAARLQMKRIKYASAFSSLRSYNSYTYRFEDSIIAV